jgi:hypothetical protein
MLREFITVVKYFFIFLLVECKRTFSLAFCLLMIDNASLGIETRD